MTRSFETAQEIREQWFRIEGAENTVRAATADGFRSVRSDVEPEYLAGLVHDLQSFLEHLFAEAFGEDGKAILDGTHELADLKEQLLEEHDLAWLPPRVVELERVVSHGRETLKAAPIIPVGDDHHLAAELQRILENERRGWFVSMYHEDCEPYGCNCGSCKEFRVWREHVERLRRNLDRQDPEKAEWRQRCRRAATQREYDAELEYLGLNCE